MISHTTSSRAVKRQYWEGIRAHFSALQKVTYLNTAGGCAMPSQVSEAGKLYYTEHEQEGDMCWNRWCDRTEGVRTQLAGFLGAQPQEIAFLANASLGMNYAQQFVGNDGRVLMIAGDFPSVTLPWVKRAQDPQFLTPRPDGSVAAEDIEKAITSDTRALAIGHVQYNSGYAFDLAELSQLCRAKGIALIVDATQSVGCLNIDLQKTPVDVLVFSGYKWSMAGYGIAGMYINADFFKGKDLPFVGWRSAEVPYKMLYDHVTSSGTAKDLELGHPPFPGIFALGAAVALMSEIGIGRIEKRVRDLTGCLHASLRKAGVEIASTTQENHTSGITMLKMPEPDAAVKELKERGVFVSVRNGLVRVSVHFYNLEKDIETFAAQLSDLSARR